MSDYGFKFEIGQIVKLIGTPKSAGSGLTWAAMSNRRLHVNERLLHECHGGVQRSYTCRSFTSDGACSPTTVMLSEIELELSEAFPEPELLAAKP